MKHLHGDQEYVIGGRQEAPKGYEITEEVEYNVPIPPPASPAHRRGVMLGLIEDCRQRYVTGVESIKELSLAYQLPLKTLQEASVTQNWAQQRRDRQLRAKQTWVEQEEARIARKASIWIGDMDLALEKSMALLQKELDRKMQRAALKESGDHHDPSGDSLNIMDLQRLVKSIVELNATMRKNLGLDEERRDQKLIGPACIDIDVDPVEKQAA